MNKELLIEKIYDYIEKVYGEVDIITTDRDKISLKFTYNDDIDKLINFINILNECNFKTIDDICDFLDWSYCYDDEVYYCGLCEKYHFINEGHYSTGYEIYGVECVEKKY